MAFPDPMRLSARFDSDRELARCARFWTGALHLGVGAKRWRLDFDDGHFRGAAATATKPGPRDIEIEATPEQWDELLATVPKAFYQDPYGAAAHHGVKLGGDTETLFAYYGALRRVIEILREGRT
jgi:hypothetical protein